MSLVPDEPQVNAWLREHGIQHEIRELQYDADLRPDCVPELLHLLKSPHSLYMHVAIAEALFARKLKRNQRREAVEVLLNIIRLKEVAKDRPMTPDALAKLGSLGLPEALGMCEEALQKPDVPYKDVIRETYVKLKRKLAKIEKNRPN